MDVLSHLLVGKILSHTQTYEKKDKFLISFFGFLPDASQFVLYPLLVWILPRSYYFPANNDWIGITEKHTWFTFAYEFPHSLTFLLLVIVPFVWYWGLPKLCVISYFLHIILDVFTHTGEWSTKILSPSRYYYVEGYTDAWAWGLSYFMASWLLLLIVDWMIMGFKWYMWGKV